MLLVCFQALAFQIVVCKMSQAGQRDKLIIIVFWKWEMWLGIRYSAPEKKVYKLQSLWTDSPSWMVISHFYLCHGCLQICSYVSVSSWIPYVCKLISLCKNYRTEYQWRYAKIVYISVWVLSGNRQFIQIEYFEESLIESYLQRCRQG